MGVKVHDSVKASMTTFNLASMSALTVLSLGVTAGGLIAGGLTACGVEPTSPASVTDVRPSAQQDGTEANVEQSEQESSGGDQSNQMEASSVTTSTVSGTTEEEVVADSDPDSVTALERCSAAGLVWQTGKKTNYTSYPDPGGEECIKYNGCMWAGYFAGCNGQQSEEWVEATNIAAVFPFGDLSGHQLCVKSGETVIIVNAIDTCGDDDCDGCCTRNRGNADALIDLESFTNQRWGLIDGPVQWADLGPRVNPICR